MLTQRWKKMGAIRYSTKESKSKVHDPSPVGVLSRKHDIQRNILRFRGGVIRRTISASSNPGSAALWCDLGQVPQLLRASFFLSVIWG